MHHRAGSCISMRVMVCPMPRTIAPCRRQNTVHHCYVGTRIIYALVHSQNLSVDKVPESICYSIFHCEENTAHLPRFCSDKGCCFDSPYKAIKDLGCSTKILKMFLSQPTESSPKEYSGLAQDLIWPKALSQVYSHQFLPVAPQPSRHKPVQIVVNSFCPLHTFSPCFPLYSIAKECLLKVFHLAIDTVFPSCFPVHFIATEKRKVNTSIPGCLKFSTLIQRPIFIVPN